MKKEIEKIKVTKAVSIQEILDKKFIKAMDDTGLELEYINLACFSKSEKVLAFIKHENSEEIEDKIIHIECDNSKVVDKLFEALKKII